MAADSTLELLHLTKRYGQTTAVDQIDLKIGAGSYCCLLGPSGCGKTSTLRMIAGHELTSEGDILLGGRNITHLASAERGTAMMFQSYALFPHLSALDNVAFSLKMRGVDKVSRRTKASELLERVSLGHLAHRKPDELSGGQQQRVALARALMTEPKVLLLDEPLSALDAKLRKDMQIELKRLQLETGITFIFVTHDQEEALTMSDRIAVMSRGKILQVGGPRDIYDRPAERFVANFIGETNFLEGEIVSAKGGSAKVRLASGALITAGLPEGTAPHGQVTVVVRPEHARIEKPAAKPVLAGVVDNVVYFGTDTHYHIKLVDGSSFTVRRQNSGAPETGFASGSKVAIGLEDGAAQVHRD